MSTLDDLLARVQSEPDDVKIDGTGDVSALDAVIRNVVAEQTMPRINLNLASFGNPDQAATRSKLAGQMKTMFGEDWAPAAIDPGDAQRRLKVAENYHVLRNNPVLARQYMDTGFAERTFDDVPKLGVVEGAVNSLKSIAGAISASVWGINSAGFGLGRAVSENLTSTVSPPSMWLAEQQRRAEFTRKDSANLGGELRGMPIMGPVYQGVQSAYQNMLLMPLGFLRSSAAAAVVPMSLISAGQAYGQARDQYNSSPFKSLGFAAAQGTAEGATEMLPMGRFIKDVNVGAPIWKMMRNQLVTENVTEQAATAWQDFNEWAMLNPDKPFQSYIDARPGAALDTLIATTTATLLQTGAVQGAMRSQIRQNRAAQATTAAQALDYLNTSIGETELSKRDRGTLQQFLQSVAQNEDGVEQTVRINALAFENTLMQAGIDPQQVLNQMTSAREQWEVARAAGVDLEIPLSEIAGQTFGTDVGNALLPHLAVGQDSMSLVEAQDFQKGQAEEFRKQAEVVMAEKSRDDAFVQSAHEVEKSIVDQLNTANRFTKDVNRVYGTMMRDFYVITAARMGITPGELFKQFPLNIVAEGQAALNQNIQQTTTPEFKNWFGDSKVVDAEGKPLVVYHGTSADISEFKKKGVRPNFTSPQKHLGHFFTDDAKYAGQYAGRGFDSEGGNILPVFISLQNPKIEPLSLIAEIEDKWSQGKAKAYAQRLKDEGYDGIIFEGVARIGQIREYVAFSPTQIKSAVSNNGEFNPNDANILHQAASVPVPDGVAQAASIEAAYAVANAEQFEYIRDLKVKLQAAVTEASGGMDLSKATADIEQYLVGMGITEASSALASNANAVGWYDIKTRQALSVVALIHPEILTNEDARFAFIYALAVTSNGQKVVKNFELAERAYQGWKATGQMPSDVGAGGPARKKVHEALEKFNRLITIFGSPKAAAEFMLTEFTVKEMKNSGFAVSGESPSETVLGAAILGPKIGNGFFANLYGVFDQLTMDRWLMRTWGRWTGTLLADNALAIEGETKVLKAIVKGVRADKDALKAARTAFATTTGGNLDKSKLKVFDDLVKAKDWEHLAEQIHLKSTYPAVRSVLTSTPLTDELRRSGNRLAMKLDGQNEAPSGPLQRRFIRKVFGQILASVNQSAGVELTMADLQALLWYPEKRLYDSAKSDESLEGYDDDDAPDYANAAAQLARSRGVAEESIVAALTQPAGRSGTVRRRRDADGAVAGGSGQAEGNNESTQLKQDNRGGFSPESLTLILGKKADLSTFLHESAHFYLKVLGDLASRPNAPAQIKQDMDRALSWFGIHGSPEASAIDTWNGMTLDEQRPYHEKWAESFEAYLFSGRAPSIELQTAFARFKSWMVRVYQSFKEFSAGHPEAEINPEVTAIFDRLLATDEQIKLAEQARSMLPLFATEQQSGMTTEEWAAYQELAKEPTHDAKAELNARGVRDLTWLRNLTKRVTRQYNAEAERLRDQEMIEARREIMTRPLYMAWQFLAGKSPIAPEVQAYQRDIRIYRADRAAELARQINNAEDQLWRESAEGQKKYRKLASMQKARAAFVSSMDDQIQALSADLMAPWDVDHPVPSDPRPKVVKEKRTNGVDETRDTLFEAIAKLGGISKDSMVSQWGIDEKGRSPQFAGLKRVWHSGGMDVDQMRLLLEQYGYLTPYDAENPNLDPREFETRFNEELRGVPQYSLNADYDFLNRDGGEALDPHGYGKLSLSDLKSMGLPVEMVERLKSEKMTAADGFSPDQVAEAFGFGSGDELVRSLAVAPSMKDAIEALTDQRMIENHGELSSPEAITKAVDAAIHNEARARLVATELRFISRAKLGQGEATPSVRVLMAAAKGFADQILGRRKVRDIVPAPFITAASKAAVAAQKAMGDGKHDVAAAELRNQLLNTTTANMAIAAREEVEKSLKYLRKFAHGNSRNSIEVEYLDQIDQLLERFDLKARSNKDVDRRTALGKWLDAQAEDNGVEPDIPDYLLNGINQVSYKNLTLDEFRGLVDAVRQVEHLGRLKNRLLTARDKRAFADVVKTLRDSIDANNTKDRLADNRERDSWVSRAGGVWKGAMAAHRKIASMVRELDGFKDGGPMWEYFLRGMNVAGDHEATMREQATVKLNALLQPVLAHGKMGGKGIYIPAIDRNLNRTERLAVALNAGNDGNMQRMMSGYQWSPMQVKAILSTLTSEDLAFVQGVWDFFESYRPQIAAKERRVSGREPNWIQPVPIAITLADGSVVHLRGGYYPIKYDPRQSIKAGQHQDAEDAKSMMRAAYTSATTRRGFTKTRAEEVKGRPILLSADGIFQGAAEVIHDLAWHEWLIDANRLLRAVGQDINDIYGAEWVTQFKKGMEDIARGEQGAQNTIERGLNHLRTGATIAGLGWNLMTSLLQPLGLSQSMVRIGPSWVARGMRTYLSDPINALDTISEKSELMRVRAKTMMREINEIQNQIGGKGKVRTATEATFFILIQKVQLVADIPTWFGAYEKAMSESTDEVRAVALADQAVIDSQGGGQVKDLAMVQRGHPAFKLFTNFYSFFNVALNLGIERTRATNFKKPGEVAKLAGDYLMLYTVPAVLGALLKDALKGGDDDEEKLIKKLIAEQISYLLGLFVGLREVTASVQKMVGVQQFNTAYAGPAGLRFFQELDKLATQIGQGDADDAMRKSAINSAGVLFHFPAGQVNRTIDGTAAVIDGRTRNPLAPVLGPPPKN